MAEAAESSSGYSTKFRRMSLALRFDAEADLPWGFRAVLLNVPAAKTDRSSTVCPRGILTRTYLIGSF